jgi:DNA-binding IclR family transcriptional regulator
MSSEHAVDRRFAQTLARGLEVLRAFQATDGPLGNQELSARTGIPKSTISRLTFTLSQLGYLEHLVAMEKYRLGASLIALGNVASATLPFMDRAADLMQALADEVGALVAMSVRNGHSMLMTHCWRPRDSSSIWLRVGTVLPLETTAPGLAYLAALDASRLRPLMAGLSSSGGVPVARLSADVDQATSELATRGFVPSFGRWNPAIYAVATPFRSQAAAEPVVFLCGTSANAIDPTDVVTRLGPRLAQVVRQLAPV